MARIHPTPIQPDTNSDAERKLYARLRDDLPDDYTVFHSVAWQHREPASRKAQDGEADFIVAHPQNGILLLEVKGGTIRMNPATDVWTTTDRFGNTHPLKRSPIKQARESRYLLRDTLAALLNMPANKINPHLGHAAAFPDTTVPTSWFNVEIPREIVMDQADMANVRGWVERAMAYYRGNDAVARKTEGERAVQTLLSLLGNDWELRPALWGEIAEEGREMVKLTEQQFTLLDMLSRQRRVLVSGCAGSGKTMIATEKALRLAKQGFRVLLTCYNERLAKDLQLKLGNKPNLMIANFHSVCAQMATQAGIRLQQSTTPEYFNVQLPEALLDATTQLPDARFDAIIVDEGQDFLPDWWIALQSLLRDPEDGIFYIFYDDNQRLYDRTLSFPIGTAPFTLSINCRNTRHIHRAVTQFYAGQSPITQHGIEGHVPELQVFGDDKDRRAKLKAVLQWLTQQERVPTDEIVVLTTSRSTLDSLVNDGSYMPRLSNQLPAPVNSIYASTVHGFKGMECAVAVLVDDSANWAEAWPNADALLYVACSRPRHHLIVLTADKADNKLRAALTN